MNFLKVLKALLVCTGISLLVLVLTSLFDILLIFFYSRFYSTALFIVTFAVGGVFATVLAWTGAVKLLPGKIETARWVLVMIITGIGLLFFFVLSTVEGGEYAPAFKAYGITMTFTSLLLAKGRFEI